MKIIVLVTALILLVGCNSSTENTTTEDRSSVKVDSVEKNNPPDINTSVITVAELPREFSFEGKMQEAWKWTDRNGENIFFTTKIDPRSDNDKGESEEDAQSADLYAFHYIKKDAIYDLAWSMHEKEMSCPLDIVTEFIKGSSTITDLDKDGIAEVKVQVALACRGDVSPSDMKLFMEENKMVYTLQGVRWVNAGEGVKFDINPSNVNLEKLPPAKAGEDTWYRAFGRYESEKSFAAAPPEFLVYARNEWLKHVMENF